MLDAVVASQRCELPFEGVLLSGYWHLDRNRATKSSHAARNAVSAVVIGPAPRASV